MISKCCDRSFRRGAQQKIVAHEGSVRRRLLHCLNGEVSPEACYFKAHPLLNGGTGVTTKDRLMAQRAVPGIDEQQLLLAISGNPNH